MVAAAATLFLVEWAAVSVTNVAEAFFLKRVGVERLPVVFLANSLLLAATSLGVVRLAAQGEPRRLLRRVLVGLGLVLLPLWGLIVAQVGAAFALLVVVAKQLDAIAVLVFWTALGGIVGGRAGKRLFGPITAGGTLGTICGSFTSAPLARAAGMGALLPIAAVVLGAAAVTAQWLWRRPARPRRAAPPPAPGLHGLRTLWRGWLLRALVSSTLLAGILGPMLYFEFSYVADLATRGGAGEQRLLELYAVVRGWINVGVLAVQVAGTASVFRWLGVPLAATVSPLIYLLGLAGLAVQTSLPAGVGAMAGATLQDHAVYDPAQRILLTLFPERVRAPVTAFVDGAVKRIGAVAGNLLVLGILALGSPALVGWIGLPIAGAWLAVAIGLWRRYAALLLEMASVEPAGPLAMKSLAALLDPSTLRVLLRDLAGSDIGRCRAACALVVEAPRRRAVATLARALVAAPPANRRLLAPGLDRLLEEGVVVSAAAARRVAKVLAAPAGLDALDRANLVQAFARLRGARWGERARRVLEAAMHDEAEAVRLAAAAARARLDPGGDIDGVLGAALMSRDAATRQVLCKELRIELVRPGTEPASAVAVRRVARLLSLLAEPATRPAAARALADAVDRHGARIPVPVAALLRHRDDGDPAVRAAVLRVVGARGIASEAGWAAAGLGAPDPAEAAAAEAALRALGPPAADALCEVLRGGRAAARARALAVLRALRNARPMLGRLVERELAEGWRLLALASALGAGGASELVVGRLHERAEQTGHAALLLLAVALDEERLEHAGSLLRRVAPGHDRAVLLEALEVLLPAADAVRLLPLLEPDRAVVPAQEVPTFAGAVAAVMAGEDRLAAVLLAGTLDATAAPVAYDGAEPAPMGPDIDTLLHLRSLDLFARLSVQQIAELAALAEEVRVPAGAVIVTEGEFTDDLFVVVAGAVGLTRGGVGLGMLGPRDFFGEMALLDGETRSATATALGPVRLLRLSRAALLRAMDEQPAIAIAICQTLSRRVRELLDERGRAGDGESR